MAGVQQESAVPAPPARVRVLVAAADLRMRQELTRWVEGHGAFEVAVQATDGAQAVSAAARVRPALAILDLALPRLHGLEAAAEIRRLVPETGIVVRSAFSAARMAQAAVDAGADAYVEKAAGSAGLLDVLEELSSSAPAATPRSDAVAPVTWRAETMELLEAIVVASPVGAVLLDKDARLVIANPVADRLLGGTPLLGADPGGRSLHRVDTMAPVREEDLPVRAVCEGTPFDDVELYVAEAPDVGDGLYVKVSGRPVLGPLGQPTGAVISVLDDTKTKQAEQELAKVHAELRRSNAELADFASTASHDLAQPLQKILGFAELLKNGGLDDPDADDYVDKIMVACRRMRSLIRDLLTYSRVATDDRDHVPVELTTVVQEVVELFEREIADSRAQVRVDPLPTVVADRTQMGQLLQNLVGNALTYVAPGVAPDVHVSASRVGRTWQVVVADNGIGVDPAERERAFGMFERLVSDREYAGTGIGLAVCARIVEHHGGRIWVEDNPGGGSRFCVTLPVGRAV